MTEPRKPRLLWTDDDGRERFLYEEYVIQDEGWDIAWATDVTAAARRLSTEPFDALILDQMLPYEGLRPTDVLWSGCVLLRWLRGKGPPPNLNLEPGGGLSRMTPLDLNSDIPAFIVSGFHDLAVEAATRDASEQDRNIPLVPKPVDVEIILSFLRQANAGSAR